MENASSPTINRENSDKAKGFRLQKLRAAKLMLETIESKKTTFFYAAIEVVEDVSITVADTESSKTQIEEDKNYDSANNFTVFSDSVRNTLVSFFDIFTNHWHSSETILLAFYTTAGIGKEKKQVLDDGTPLTLPKSPVLEILKSGTIDDSTVQLVKLVITEEYSKQYSEKSSKGHLETLKKYTIEQFRNFLTSISWFFSQEDEDQLKSTVISLIKNSSLHNFKVANKEEIILALIMEKLDERQSLADYASRFVTTSDVLLIFKQAESEERTEVLDPVWTEIKKLESEITDKRNLREKILAVHPNYPEKNIGYLARMACRSKTEQANGNKSFLSLKYRAYEACEGYICDTNYKQPATDSELDAVLKDFQAAANKSIAELKKDYSYTVSNGETVKGVVMDLLDSCYISLDKNQNEQ